jgi:hypothetical protein
MAMVVPLSVDIWYRLWREQLIDDIALTRITVITEISELSTPYAKILCFFSTNNLIP